MKRNLPFGVLFSNWIVGFFLFFLFPPQIETQVAESNQITIETVKGEISESFQTPENLSIEIEWKLQFFIHSSGGNRILDSSSYSQDFVSAYSTLPLFDVKKLFIHFFHTW